MGGISNVLVGSTKGPNLEVQDRRGVEIIDAYGDCVFISDDQIPRVIALLARHLGGEEIAMAGQEDVRDIRDSETLEEALNEVEQRLLRLQERRDALLVKQQQITEYTLLTAIEPVETEWVPLAQVFAGWLGQGDTGNDTTR